MKVHMNQYIIRKILRNMSVVICAAQLAACGEVAFKRGGNATELQQVRKVCQDQHNDQKQIESCLASHGWVVQHLNTADPDPVIEASYEADNRQTSHPKTANNEMTSTAISHAEENNQQKSTQPETATDKPPVIKHPTDLFKINSWWKLGNNSTLNADIQHCVDSLGPEHQPDKELHQATRALLQCMNSKGWKALREK